jgi:uncharacterized protein YceH (UPF0502 family)
MHLFSGDAPPATEGDSGEPHAESAAAGPGLAARVAALESTVAELRAELEALKSRG